MNEQEQRIAIAEACGWIKQQPDKCGWDTWYLPGDAEADNPDDVPDYLNDLNAMAEAEKVVRDDGRNGYELFEKYLTELDLLVCSNRGQNPSDESWSGWIAFASASQRAEAFLRCIGKWIEEPPAQDPYYELLAKDYVDASKPRV